jgi:hypothetical protein
MKEGFGYSTDRKHIVNENISEAEKKHWATFKPTEETSSDASQEEIIEETLDKHEEIFNKPKEIFGSREASKETDTYQQQVKEKGKKLYQLAKDLYDCMIDFYHEEPSQDMLTHTITQTKAVEVLNRSLKNIKYILKEEDELTNEQLTVLGVVDRTEYAIKQLLEKLESKKKLSPDDLETINMIAQKFEAQAHELMFMDTSEDAPKQN